MDRLERSWSDGPSNNVTEEGGRQQFRSKYEYKVNVESLPEKKGKVIKHVEYIVTSEKHHSQVIGLINVPFVNILSLDSVVPIIDRLIYLFSS